MKTPCSIFWVPRESRDLELTFKQKYNEQDPRNLEFLFGCKDCKNWWAEVPGDQVPVNFEDPWETVPGDAVPVTFVCNEDDSNEYTFFNGFFEAYEGASLAFDFNETLRVNISTGEYFGGVNCSGVANNDIAIAPSNMMTMTVLNNSGTAIQTSGWFDQRAGANFRLVEEPLFDESITFTWKNTITPQSWSVGANSHANLEIYVTDSYADLVLDTRSGSYGTLLLTPKPVISWVVNFDTGAKGSVNYRNAAGTTIPLFTPNVPVDFNLADGSRQLTLTVTRVGSRSYSTLVEVSAWADDVFLGSGIADIGSVPTNRLAPIWYYKNYVSSPPLYTISNVGVTQCNEFLTTSPMQGFGLIDNYDGQTLDLTLSTRKVFPLTVHHGETANVYLATDSNLEQLNFGTGEYSSAILTDNKPWQIVANAYTGETLELLQLSVSSAFEFFSYTGEAASADLTTFPAATLGNIIAYTGETAEATLAPSYALEMQFYTGEALSDLQLGTDTYLDDLVFFTGEYSDLELTQNLPWEFVGFVSTGETATFTLATTDIVRPLFYTGETASFDFTLPPVPEILLQGYDGQTATFQMSTAANLGSVFAYDGAVLSLSIDNAPFWRMHTGESVWANLATTTTIVSEGYTGEAVSIELSSRPSEGIGVFRAYEGSRSDIIVSISKQVLLYPNVISTRTQFNVEFDINTSFDLLNTTCCPVKETHGIIELNHQPAPDEKYDGDKTVATVDLSTLPRFQFNFFDGAHARVDDPNYLGIISFHDGHQIDIVRLQQDYTDFRLCYGNFIPDGDNTTIELISVYDDNCVSDYAYTGETMEMVLENNIGLNVDIYTGEHLDFNITIDPIMLFRAYHGEYARVTNLEFGFSAHHGELMQIEFYEDKWDMHHGEFMEIDIVTEYNVEFLELGCLDNEYIPINENGDPDLEKFNPVPVELEFFRHEIKARCF